MFWVPLSQAIVSGLTFATLLTLVATPAMLAVPHQVRGVIARVRRLFNEHVTPALPRRRRSSGGPTASGV
jgi:multidrug efflux pump